MKGNDLEARQASSAGQKKLGVFGLSGVIDGLDLEQGQAGCRLWAEVVWWCMFCECK